MLFSPLSPASQPKPFTAAMQFSGKKPSVKTNAWQPIIDSAEPPFTKEQIAFMKASGLFKQEPLEAGSDFAHYILEPKQTLAACRALGADEATLKQLAILLTLPITQVLQTLEIHRKPKGLELDLTLSPETQKGYDHLSLSFENGETEKACVSYREGDIWEEQDYQAFTFAKTDFLQKLNRLVARVSSHQEKLSTFLNTIRQLPGFSSLALPANSLQVPIGHKKKAVFLNALGKEAPPLSPNWFKRSRVLNEFKMLRVQLSLFKQQPTLHIYNHANSRSVDLVFANGEWRLKKSALYSQKPSIQLSKTEEDALTQFKEALRRLLNTRAVNTKQSITRPLTNSLTMKAFKKEVLYKIPGLERLAASPARKLETLDKKQVVPFVDGLIQRYKPSSIKHSETVAVLKAFNSIYFRLDERDDCPSLALHINDGNKSKVKLTKQERAYKLSYTAGNGMPKMTEQTYINAQAAANAFCKTAFNAITNPKVL